MAIPDSSYGKFNKISIIGLGLIGGSIAKAAYEKKIATHIIGYDTSKEDIELANKSGIFQYLSSSLDNQISGSDIIILCIPVNSFKSRIIEDLNSLLDGSEAITDACSVKRFIRKIADGQLTKFPKNFIPAHPIAGSEKSGFVAADAKLFDNKKTIITCEGDENKEALNKVIELWQLLGCNTEIMQAAQHDKIYAKVSHLPQFMSWSFAEVLKAYGLEPNPDSIDIYNKFTRLASSNPTMWQGIFEYNWDYINQHIDLLANNLNDIIDNLPLDNKKFGDYLLKAHKKRLSIKDTGNIEIGLSSDLAGTIIPAIIACALISITKDEELPYIGTGYKDFTLPASQINPDTVQIINNNIQDIKGFLENFVKKLNYRLETGNIASNFNSNLTIS